MQLYLRNSLRVQNSSPNYGTSAMWPFNTGCNGAILVPGTDIGHHVTLFGAAAIKRSFSWTSIKLLGTTWERILADFVDNQWFIGSLLGSHSKCTHTRISNKRTGCATFHEIWVILIANIEPIIAGGQWINSHIPKVFYDIFNDAVAHEHI